MSDEAKKRKVVLAHRMLRFHTGETLLLPFGMYEDEKTAKDATDTATAQIGELFRTCTVGTRYQNPDGQMQFEEKMRLADFCNALGIRDIGHMYKAHDVHGSSVIVQVDKKLVIPTRH